MAQTSDPLIDRYRKAWVRFDRDDRRRVMRAVNRLEPLDNPAEAALAVVFARRQRRMWTRWWWIYPLIPAAIALPNGWWAVGANFIVGSVFVGVFAAVFGWRAKRAERMHMEVLETAQRRRRSGSPKGRAVASDRPASTGRRRRRRK